MSISLILSFYVINFNLATFMRTWSSSATAAAARTA